MEQTEAKQRIAELRQRYNRLKAICGPQGISRETIAEYTQKMQQLQAMLN